MWSLRSQEHHSHELVGFALSEEEIDGRKIVRFQCTNREVFVFIRPPAIKPMPAGELVRTWLNRLDKEDTTRDLVCVHWDSQK